MRRSFEAGFHRGAPALRLSFRASVLALIGAAVVGAPALAAPHPLQVKVVYAHSESAEIDPRLKELAKQLKDPKLGLRFSAFALKDQAEFKLEPGASGRMQVPGGEWMHVELKELVKDGHPEPLLRLVISVKKLDFKTTVQIAQGATLVVRGPDYNKGTLILVITRPKG